MEIHGFSVDPTLGDPIQAAKRRGGRAAGRYLAGCFKDWTVQLYACDRYVHINGAPYINMIYVSVRFVLFIVGHPDQTSNDDLTWSSWTDGKTISNRHLFVDCGPYVGV